MSDAKPSCCPYFSAGSVCSICQDVVLRAHLLAVGGNEGYLELEMFSKAPELIERPLCLGLRLSREAYLKKLGWDWRDDLPVPARQVHRSILQRMYGVPCSTLLGNANLSALPHHVCLEVCRASVIMFAGERFGWHAEDIDGPSGRGMIHFGSAARRKYATTFPLPAGADSVRMRAEELGVRLVDLPNPLFDGEAYLGLVVRHREVAGTVTLFALWERSELERIENGEMSIWHSVAPRTEIDYAEQVPKSRDPLDRARATLETWYRQYVTGNKRPFSGRPPGARQDTNPALAQMLVDAVRDLLREHDKVTYKSVSGRMGIGVNTLRKYVRTDKILEDPRLVKERLLEARKAVK